MATEEARHVARDIVVAWLQRTEVKEGAEAGKFLGKVYQDVVHAVEETTKSQFK